MTLGRGAAVTALPFVSSIDLLGVDPNSMTGTGQVS